MNAKMTPNLKKRVAKYGTKNVDKSVTLSAVFTTYGGICQECGIETKRIHPPRHDSASIEHIIPLSRGGSHTWDNVELLCHRCNTGRNKSDSKLVNVFTFKVFGYIVNIVRREYAKA